MRVSHHRLALVLLLLPWFGSARGSQPPPNLVILFADDLGYGDLGTFGHPTIQTPHLDRMAGEGVKLTSFYVAAPSCTPSRISLLTGRYPMRSGLYRVVFPEDTAGIPSSEVTLAEALKPKGYRSMAVGKWHLGYSAEFLPGAQGFDQFFGLPYSNDMLPPWVQTRIPLRLYRDGRVLPGEVDQTTLTDRYTEEATRFIRESANRPFFLYLAYTMPHVPLYVPQRFAGHSKRGLYGDVIEQIDWSVGQILQTLQEAGVDRRTLVLFTSDNGPWLVKELEGGSAGLLREGKGTTYEGGMRVPCIVRWPDRIPAGTVNAEPISSLDIMPTFLSLVGADPPPGVFIDGADVMPALEGRKLVERAFYYYRGPFLEAVRRGQWKLRETVTGTAMRDLLARVLERSRVEQRTFIPADFEDVPVVAELYNVDSDPGEQFNLADRHPEIVRELRRQMRHFAHTIRPGPAFAVASLGRPSS